MDTQTRVTIEEAGKQIVQLVRERGGGVSFIEVDNLLKELGFATDGNRAVCHHMNDHIILWLGMSEEFMAAFGAAMSTGDIVYTPTNPLVYFVDGAIPTSIPIIKVKTIKGFLNLKTDQWLPVTLHMRDSPRMVEILGPRENPKLKPNINKMKK